MASCGLAKIYFEIDGYMTSKNMVAIKNPQTEIEHKKQSYDGYDIHYFVSGAPDGELVVFLHPAFSDHRAFDRQVDFFAKKYRVISVDMIGHGLSQVRKSNDKIDASTRHIADIMAAEGYDKAHMVGVSLGSLVAQYFAVENPQKILTLTSLGGYNINKINPEAAEAQGGGLGMMLRALFSMSSFRAKAAMMTAYTMEGQALFHKSASLFTRKSFMVMRGFENIIKDREFAPTYPTLILVGDHDIEFAKQLSQTWHADFPSNKYQLIDGAGHCANMDLPDVFNDVVGEFLAGSEGRAK